MESMTLWIEPLVERCFKEALQWKIGAGLNSQDSRHCTYQDDESNLRVRLNFSRSVQVIEWQSSPILCAVLSDSATTIKAYFAELATEQWVQRNRRPINKETTGTIFRISGFELLFTTFGPKDSRVTLFITRFEVCKCKESAIFGNPTPIGGRERVMSMMKTLSNLRNKDYSAERGMPPNRESQENSPIRSQAGSEGNDSETEARSQVSTSATQMGFSTQTPGLAEAAAMQRDSSLNPVKDERARKNISTLMQDLPPRPKKPSPAKQPLQESKSFKNISVSRPLAHGQNSKKDSLPLQPSDQESKTDAEDASTTAVFKHVEIITSPQKNQAVVPDTNVQKTSSPDPHTVRAPEDTDLRSVRDTIHEEETLSTVETNGCPTANLSSNLGESGMKVASPAKPYGAGMSNISSDNDDPWAEERVAKRISRRVVRIPKDQQKMLENSDSWIPPDPGKRPPQGYVPLQILQQLNEYHDRKVRQQRQDKERLCKSKSLPPEQAENDQSEPELPPARPHVLLDIEEHDRDEDSESEEEVVPEWSSSPPRKATDGQLPPHSSIEEVVSSQSGPKSEFKPHSEHSYHTAPPKRSKPEVKYSSERSLRTALQEPEKGLLEVDEVTNEIRDHAVAQEKESEGHGEQQIQQHLVNLSSQGSLGESEESEMEFSVPIGLKSGHSTRPSPSGKTSHTHPPMSTASSDKEPSIQVKGTPFNTGKRNSDSVHSPKADIPQRSPDRQYWPKGQAHDRLSIPSDPIIPATYRNDPELEEPQPPNSVPNPTVDDARLEPSQSEFDQEGEARESQSEEDERMAELQIQSEMDAYSQRSRPSSPTKSISDVEMIDEHVEPPVRPQNMEDLVRRPSLLPTPEIEKAKRKSEDADLLSPNITKRRKPSKPPPKFHDVHDNLPVKTPATRARERRRAYFETLKTGYQPPSPKENYSSATLTDPAPHKPHSDLKDSRPAASQSVPEVFTKFTHTYKNYKGDLEHFKRMCQTIMALREKGGMLHPSLWDDFIIRRTVDYPRYQSKCATTNQTPDPYEKFYEEQVEEPEYVSRVVKVSNIGSMFEDTARTQIVVAKAPSRRGHSEINQESADSVVVDLTLESPIPENEWIQFSQRRIEAGIKSSQEHHTRSPKVRLFDRNEPTMHELDTRQLVAERGDRHSSVTDWLDGTSSDPGSPSKGPEEIEARDEHEAEVERGEEGERVEEKEEEDGDEHEERDISHIDDDFDFDLPNVPTEQVPPPAQPLDRGEDSAEEPEEEHQWWHDANTSFKAFVRAYVNLKSERTGQPGSVPVGSRGVVMPSPWVIGRNVDIFGWGFGKK